MVGMTLAPLTVSYTELIRMLERPCSGGCRYACWSRAGTWTFWTHTQASEEGTRTAWGFFSVMLRWWSGCEGHCALRELSHEASPVSMVLRCLVYINYDIFMIRIVTCITPYINLIL